MAQSLNNGAAQPQTNGAQRQESARKPYQAPMLVRFGALGEITRGNGGPGGPDDPVFDPTPSSGTI